MLVSAPDSAAAAPPASAVPSRARITLRAALLALALAACFGVLIPFNDYKFGNTYIGAAHLPPGAIAALLVLVAGQAILRAAGNFSAKFRLTRDELLTVYITCLFSVLVPGRASENFFVVNLIGPFYYATRENNWLSFLQPYLKPWFTPALTANGEVNRTVVDNWYVGGTAVPWGAWLVPLTAWTLLIGALYVMLACLGVMLRAQWAEREALAFPLIRLPLEMTDGADGQGPMPFFRSPAMWTGFGVAVVLRSMTSLNLYYPDVPPMPLSVDTSRMMTEAPWNQLGPSMLMVIPLVVGVTYLLTSEVAFSFWFFFLLHKFELILAYQMGYSPSTLPDPAWTRGWAKTFISYQNIGAYFAFAALLLWSGREHYGHIARRAFGLAKPGIGEREEALSYPVAFWGFALSSGLLLAWTCAAGVSPQVAVMLWLSYFVIALGLARVVSEGGLLYVNHGWSPLGPMAHLFGGGPGTWLAPASAVPASVIQGALMVDMKAFLLPSFLHAFKIAHDRKMPQRPLLVLIFACIAIAYGLGIWTNVRLGYTYGGLQLHPWFARVGAMDSAVNAREFLRPVKDSFALNGLAFAAGAIIIGGVVLARGAFSWFPLHPIGFIMWSPYVMHAMWFSIFLGWLLKMLIMRFGGTESYRKAMPGFMGLALGDVSMMIFWAAIAAWQGRTGHMLMPG